MQFLSEPGRGSDARRARTSAVRCDGHWLLNGGRPMRELLIRHVPAGDDVEQDLQRSAGNHVHQRGIGLRHLRRTRGAPGQ